MPQKIPCKVLDVTDHGDHVYSVLLRPESTLPRFLAGQFLHLALDPFRPGDFWPESRVFSIASAPAQRDALRITYAVKGLYTARMERELQPDRDVWVKMPYGEFTVDIEKDVCLVAGGTGITAFTAFLEQLPAEHARRVVLFYGARRPELLIYRSVAEEFAARCKIGRIYLFAEQHTGGDPGLLQGRLDTGHVWACLSDPLSLTYYIAGPPVMIQGLMQGLRANGVDACRILIDAWE
jgi:ferredoxin-NADP reductase